MAKRKKTAGKSRTAELARIKTGEKPAAKAKGKAEPAVKQGGSNRTASKAAGTPPMPQTRRTTRSRPSAKTAEGGLPDLRSPADAQQTGRPSAKSRLTAEGLAEFRTMLLEKRAQLVGDVQQLQEETLKGSRQDSTGDLSSMPIHMADLGSDNWDQEFNLVLIQNERNLLKEIDEALARIEDGTYGRCLATGRPITKARLRAKPWAKYCIEYARMMETGHG